MNAQIPSLKFIILLFTVAAMLLVIGIVQQAGAAEQKNPNVFNRLLKPKKPYNLPPAKDGYHDPDGEGVAYLQPPKEAFKDLVPAKVGNHVDWVKSLERGKINPRFDRLDPKAKPIVMDLNIVREVKGSMPDVVYPHKQHTEWLDCSNCHPAIFVPQKGANQISMAAILMGQKCGVCHGKVAFPITAKTCRKCHSRPKGKKGKKGKKVKAQKAANKQ